MRLWEKMLILLSVLLTVPLLNGMFTAKGIQRQIPQRELNLLEKYDQHLAEQVGDTVSFLSGSKKVYRLNDRDLVAPKPNPSGYGYTQDPKELIPVLEAASELLEGQQTLFSPSLTVKECFGVRYYRDETILVLTWKQEIEDCTYTFSEIKLAHASQFRRFFSEGAYSSGVLRTTTEMAKSVNAVVASSGDYYEYRSFGIVVNDGEVYRAKGELLDTCYIDQNGDLLFTYASELQGEEAVRQFVEEKKVRFSLSFGPVMIENGAPCVPHSYNSGEINKDYARAALCQMGPLHYVIVTANMEEPCYSVPTVAQFAQNLHRMGIPRAYAIDGGQTAAIAMDNTLINKVSYGCQREISDIIYFATALPEQYGEEG